MSRSFAISLNTSRVALGLPISRGRKLELVAKKTWVAIMVGLTLFFIGTYLYQVNRAASKSFVLTSLERNKAQLDTQVADLENASAKMQSLANIEKRLRNRGYVSVDRMEFVDVPRGYAMVN